VAGIAQSANGFDLREIELNDRQHHNDPLRRVFYCPKFQPWHPPGFFVSGEAIRSMTILNRLYASGGTEIEIPTLQITDGVVTHYLTDGWDDVVATLETGETVTFIACGMALALPARNGDGTQDLKFALCNITGEISEYIQTVLREKRQCRLAYRSFLDTDVTAPTEQPVWLDVKDGQWTATQVDVVAGYFDLLKTAWPREIWTLQKFPGNRYIA